ncbi:MAG: hypothetical protein ACI8ZM_000368 [Crocinitomix sp.]
MGSSVRTDNSSSVNISFSKTNFMKQINKIKFILMVILGLFFGHSWGQVTTFNYTAGMQTYVVPAGVTLINIEAFGAQGGTSDNDAGSCTIGGWGGSATGDLIVTPGETLYIYVGGEGFHGNVGGWNGAGEACSNIATCAKGGGSSDVRQGGTTLTDRVIVAGGGGGAEWSGCSGTAGHGGGLNGEGGVHPSPGGRNGGGGSQVAGGTAGSGGYSGAAGTSGLGGASGAHPAGHSGSGGGGWYGGGGSAEDGHGGGGSSYITGLTDALTVAGVRTGSGQIIITELCEALTVTVSATEVCEGDLITLDATSANGGAITWDGGVTNAAAFAPPLGTTTYNATSDHIDDCEFQINILVHALPTVTASVDDSEVCDGDSFTFTGGGADTYTWDLGVTNGVAFTAAVGTDTYTVTGVDGNGCQNTTTVDATVYALPTATASVDDSEVCDGESFTFTGGGADTYVWDLGVTDGVAFTAAIGTATYTVTGTDGNGCQNTATVDATVYNLPTVTASVDDSEVCDGESFTFTGGGADTYVWDLGVTDGVAFTTGVGTATYTVTGIDGNGCQNTATVDATVYALPTVTASVDDSEVCDGESFTFTGSGADTYTWDLGVTNGVAFTAGVGTATYTVTGIDGNGCQNTATVDATVYNLPTVTASVDDSEVCDGESFTFTGGGADTYTWDLGVTDGVAFTAAVGTATYTVTGIDGNGCENTATVAATVYNLPTVTASVDDSEVCDGESFTFTGGGADTYVWDLGVTDGVAFTAVVGTATYTVTGVDGNGCQNTATVDATVYNLPTVTASVDDSEVCDGESFTFTGGGADTYTWDLGVTDGVAFTAAVGTATYTVTGIDGNGCQNTATVDATVYALPTVTASVDDSEVCDGHSFIFTGGGADTYTWDLGVTDGVAFEALVGTATYTVTGIDGNGCVNTASVDATVYGLPSVVANATDLDLCFDEAVTFTGSGALTYDWDMGVIDAVPFTPPFAGTETYTVVGTDVNGCENTANIDVSVNDEIVITYTSYDEVYGGDGEIDITVTGGVPAYTFDWDIDGTGDFDDSEDLTDLVAGTYVVEVKDAVNCTATVSIDVVLSCTPLTVTVSDYFICKNELLILDATSLSGADISWDAGAIDGIGFYPDTTGEITYTATSEDGSDCPLLVEIEVLEIPVVAPTIGGESYCEGDTIVLGAGGDADFYSWDLLDLTPSVGVTTYTLTGVFDETGCSNSTSIDVTVHELPIVNASTDHDEICLGNTVILTADGAVTYLWDPATIINGVEYTPEGTGFYNYTVTGTDENGCVNEASVDVNVIEGLTLSYAVTHVSGGGDGEIDLTIAGGTPSYSIDWDNDGTGDFDDDEDLVGLSNGLYTVEVKGSEGCVGDAAIWVYNTLGAEKISQIDLSVYPNPATNNVMIEYGGTFNYTLMAINGDVITTGVGKDKKNLDLKDLSDGIYLITINTEEKTKTIKIIKK